VERPTVQHRIERGTAVGVDDRTARRFFVLLLLGATFLLAVVVRPLASALFMAAVLAGSIEPLHRWLASRGRGRRRQAARPTVVDEQIP
jgi:predicted PurR-regulated permease PerM